MVGNWIKLNEKNGNCVVSFWNVDIVLDESDVKYLMKLLSNYQYEKARGVVYEL